MATESFAAPPPVFKDKHSYSHPLAPVTAEEIENAVSIMKSQWPENTNFQFKAVTLQEPPKAEAVPYIEAEFQGDSLPHIDRRVFVTYYIRNTVRIPPLDIEYMIADGRNRTNSTKPWSI